MNIKDADSKMAGIAKQLKVFYYDTLGVISENDQMKKRIKGLFSRIKHGDREHQLWLKNEINEYFKEFL